MIFFKNEQAYREWTATHPAIFFVRSADERDDEVADDVQGPYYVGPEWLILRVPLPERIEHSVVHPPEAPYRVLRKVEARSEATVSWFVNAMRIFATYLHHNGTAIQGSTIQEAKAALERYQRGTITRWLRPAD